MNVLVTGGAGFIGSHVAEAVWKAGHRVRILDNFSTGYAENLAGFDAEVLRGDVRDRETVRHAIRGCEAVCHLAASVGNQRSMSDPWHDAETNVLGTINVLEAMREEGVPMIVYSSSAAIFGEPRTDPVAEDHPCEPLSPYGVSKLAGEKMCIAYMHLYGIRAVCLRYFNVFGPRQRYDAYGNVIPIFTARMLRGQSIVIYGDGLQTRDFVHVRDVARANLAALDRKDARGVFNVGTGERLAIRDLANLVIRTGAEVPVEYAPPRPGDVRHCTADARRLREILGIQCDSGRDHQIQEYVEWLRGDPSLRRLAEG